MPKAPKPEPVPVQFSRFDGGKMSTCLGMLEDIVVDHIRVTYVDETGTDQSVKFRRSPGPTSGWGIGLSKFWRLTDVERKKYCHPDIPMRSHK